MKQSEKQNSGFPDILMRIQDLSACGKHEFQKLQKDMDLKKKSEIDELACTEQKLSAVVKDVEHHIAELQERLQQELQHAKQEAREAVEAIVVVVVVVIVIIIIIIIYLVFQRSTRVGIELANR